jgi:hypothetical protein
VTTTKLEDETVQPVGLSPITAAANLRRSVLRSCVLAVVAIIVCSVLGHPLMGLFGTLGLALGALNNWMLQRSVVEYGSNALTGKKKFRRGVVGRLGLITVLGVGAPLISYPDGFGVLAGVALFHVVMLVGAAVPVFRSLRPTS